MEEFQFDPQIEVAKQINSRLLEIAEIEQSGELPPKEQNAYEALKQEIRDLNGRKRELHEDLTDYHQACQYLEKELDRLINNLVSSLEKSREQFVLSFDRQLKGNDADTHKKLSCQDKKISIARTFRSNLQEGKKAADWINGNLNSWVRLSGQYALRRRIFYLPIWQLFYKASDEDIEDFYFSLKQLIIRIERCSILGRPNLLTMHDVPLILNWRVHKNALLYLKQEAVKASKQSPGILSPTAANQIESYINYLIQQLPQYPERDPD